MNAVGQRRVFTHSLTPVDFLNRPTWNGSCTVVSSFCPSRIHVSSPMALHDAPRGERLSRGFDFQRRATHWLWRSTVAVRRVGRRTTRPVWLARRQVLLRGVAVPSAKNRALRRDRIGEVQTPWPSTPSPTDRAAHRAVPPQWFRARTGDVECTLSNASRPLHRAHRIVSNTPESPVPAWLFGALT
ncbi:MAG: hypothetical protein CM15mP78_01540 [Candidatus Poseidoniales archaeon]|nr:MAG: hypothetical protein CM15mP78_01540 [Candidatus Poseidoniales archaeon]